MSDRKHPWSQQEKESAKSYRAFQIYRDMGADRSTAKVAQELGNEKSLIDRWSSKHDWSGRVRAWDEFIAEQEMDEIVEQRKELIRKVNKAASRMVDFVLDSIELMSGESGELKQTLSHAEMRQWLRAALDLSSQTFGELRQRIRSTGPADKGAAIRESILRRPEAAELYYRFIELFGPSDVGSHNADSAGEVRVRGDLGKRGPPEARKR